MKRASEKLKRWTVFEGFVVAAAQRDSDRKRKLFFSAFLFGLNGRVRTSFGCRNEPSSPPPLRASADEGRGR